MSTFAESHERWSQDADYREAYERLGPGFEVARAFIAARTRAGFTQAELAARMKTTQSAVARLERVECRPHRGRWRRLRGLQEPDCESASIQRRADCFVRPQGHLKGFIPVYDRFDFSEGPKASSPRRVRAAAIQPDDCGEPA